MSYAIVNEAAKYDYIAIAKAGCTSARNAIADHLGVTSDELHARRFMWPLRDIAHRHDLFRFTIVRHPADRLVSCWADWMQPPFPSEYDLRTNPQLAKMQHWPLGKFIRHVIDEDDWQMNSHYAPQWSQLLYCSAPMFDVAVKLEEIDSQWPAIMERTGLGPLPKLRTSDHAPWITLYPLYLLSIVEERWACDYDNLRYPKIVPSVAELLANRTQQRKAVRFCPPLNR